MTRPPAADGPERVQRGKGTRRSRCRDCHALVLSEALDTSGRCQSCTAAAAQGGLFPVRPFKRRTNTPRW